MIESRIRKPQPSGWSVPVPLAVVLLLAAAFRAVLFHLASTRNPFFEGLILDSEVYDAWARRIAAGGWAGPEAFYFPPLYPYLLGLLYAAAGPSVALAAALQSLLGLANLLLLHRIGATVFGARAGLLAACGAALYAPLPFFETKILATTLGLTLALAALLALVRAESAAGSPGHDGRRWDWRGLRPWTGAGLLIGAAALCVPGTALLAALYAGWSLRRDRRPAAGILLGAFLATFPVLVHNLAVAGDPLPLSGQGGITFHQGNHPGANGLYAPLPGFSGSAEDQPREEMAIAEREAGRSLNRSQVSLHFLGKGLAFILDRPGAWLRLEGRKLGYLLGNEEASTEYSLRFERERVPWLRLAFLPFALIAGAGVAGLAADRTASRRPGARAVLVHLLAAAAVPLLFFVSSRYRLPLAAGLLLYAGAYADRLARDPREPVRRPAPFLLGLVVALLSWIPFGGPVITAEANVQYNLGNLLSETGRHREAIAAYDRALAAWPAHPFAWINRGNSLDRLGRAEEALASYRRAEEARPGFWTACRAQGIVLHRQGRYAEEAEAYRRCLDTGGAEARFLLGNALFRLGEAGEAETRLEEAIGLEPRHVMAHVRLAEIRAGRGEIDRARAALRRALEIDPANAAARALLARLGG
ncbi:MAG: tetratricopeptide repeat protein [Candidatus Polarisedimenticolia bacterium]